MLRYLQTIILLLICLTIQARHSLVVGIAEVRGTGSASVGRSYIQAVLMGGHVPLIIPDTNDSKQLRTALRRIDAFCFLAVWM